MPTRKKKSPKKKHWTQTPAGRKFMAQTARERFANKKGKYVSKTKAATNNPSQNEELETATKVGYATFTTWINLYSEFTGISESALAKELGNALLAKSLR